MSIITRPISFRLPRFWHGRHTLSPACHPQTAGASSLPITQLACKEKQWLPALVQASPVALRYLRLLGVIDWDNFPQVRAKRPKPGPVPTSPVPYIAAFLVKLDQGCVSMGQLRQYLVDHPALTWLLGFPLKASSAYPCGFDVEASLPSAPRFSRILRDLPNDRLQFLLDETVRLLIASLPAKLAFGERISLDTKHILAWVRENNPKIFIKEGRWDKNKQPPGDKDCRLGFKPCKNQRGKSTGLPPATPRCEAQPASGLGVAPGDFYWGYASGIVVTKLAGWGEFVLAELTQTFDKSDPSYFFPLMEMTERRLGHPPKFGALDAAFDAWYVYQYFHDAGGFAAVPFSANGGHPPRTFSADGLPLCQAGLPMPVKSTFFRRATLVPHRKARHACPLLFPEPTGKSCPVDHQNWPNGGCLSTIATAVGARIRYQLDRDSDDYKALYRERTATERINSLAKELGIERPKLRNQQSITNQNTLIYVLLNLRALQRVKAKLSAQSDS